MTIIDPAKYPNIHWKWRIFVRGEFVGYMQATVDEVMYAMTDYFYGVVNRQYLSVDLL